MKIIFLLLLPFIVPAHPGIGIVKDSKGNIFYTDLEQVWKISNGIRAVVVPNVHTHELYIDRHDNLYGEHLRYEGEAVNTFSHYMWMLTPGGSLDTIVGMRQAYIQTDYSLARDLDGNEYYIKLRDSTHIFKKSLDDKETVFATGNLNGVVWLHVQSDGSLLYVHENAIYRAGKNGMVTIIGKDVADKSPSFTYYGNYPRIWGVWQDGANNVYAAVFSDQSVKKIENDGSVKIIYRSKDNWTPIHGVFDNAGALWVLECSDKNEVRVVEANPGGKVIQQNNSITSTVIFAGGIALVILLAFLIIKARPMKRKSI